MQALDTRYGDTVDAQATDPSVMPESSSQIHSSNRNCSKNSEYKQVHGAKHTSSSGNNGFSTLVARRERPSRACTQRAAARLQAVKDEEVSAAESERKKRKAKRKERLSARLLNEDLGVDGELQEVVDEEDEKREENGDADGSSSSLLQFHRSKIVTPLVVEPEASQLPHWKIRSMWELASLLNFLNVFRPLLNVKVEFSAEELETALITPNKTLADIHIPLLRAIPPVTRMALGPATWVTVLCRKLRDWWHWVAEGDLPIVASHGSEVEMYNTLDPGIRVVILKALCNIRVEQDDIRNYIDHSIKHSVRMSEFRKERIGGDSRGISYWFEDDPVVGHRLYREIRTFEATKGKGKSVPPIPCSSYQWETVATNLDEFQNVSEKLFTSENLTEVFVGKKLKRDMLPDIEKVYKKKEKLLKKQHREALMLDSMMSLDGLTGGRSLRDRKTVAYTFDDYDQTINEAIKITKKRQSSPETFDARDPSFKLEPCTNGRLGGPTPDCPSVQFSTSSPIFSDGNEVDVQDDHKAPMLETSNRQRQRRQRYSVKKLMEAISDSDLDSDGDEDIVGEVVYDDEYLRKRKQRKISSGSEGDEEYHLEEETHEEDDDENITTSEESDAPRRLKPPMGRTRRETKLRSADELRSGPRRSTRATRNRINYRQYELSETDSEGRKPKKRSTFDTNSNESNGAESSRSSEGSDENKLNLSQPIKTHHEVSNTRENGPIIEHLSNATKEENADHEDDNRKRRFLDLNELAPVSGFDDGSNFMGDDSTDDF